MTAHSLNIIFAGTPAFSAVTLDVLLKAGYSVKAVYTQPDRPAGRGQRLSLSPVKQLALDYQLPIYQPLTLRDKQEQHILANINADIMIVVAYGLLLPLPVLQAPRLGCINIHASLLPRWRGAAPIQRAILSGDKNTGITIMQMEEGLDTGPMLYSVECQIESYDTTQTLHDKLALLGSKALIASLEQLSSLIPQKQNNDLATYAHKISKDEATLDWNLAAEELDRKIRAFNPWPVAQTFIDSVSIRIWKAQVKISSTMNATPGEIIQVTKDGIDVATAKDVLRIIEMQLPGGKCLPVKDILNARREMFAVGKCFDSAIFS
ncbi:MAG: methionyl-tRNA formyltransferase [Acidobacteriaceae bacterium]|nr:methionyl-tRNA formyltransferase [Gammaproteobacteria bacterium]MBV9156765.1 methionyl-tRNA formyltransferase [Acidobacteriaceae bacterium]